MFQEMINGSIAVLTKPSVSTFEEHEKNNLTWALIYSAIAGVINAILAAITLAIYGSGIDTSGLDPATAAQFEGMATGGGIGGIIGSLFGTVIFSLIYWGIVYGLGRAFGGTGQFGELAWGLSLFSAPLAIFQGLSGLIPFLGGILALVAGLYSLYLTYLAIQSGLNLPSNKALYVILIMFAILVVLGLCFGIALAGIIAAAMGAAGS